MKPIYSAIVCFILVLLLSSCASIDLYRGPFPNQDISSPVPEGKTRVIFFNSDENGWFSGIVQIEIDGLAGPYIEELKYFQTFLAPGTHSLKTEHIDSFAWREMHKFEVGRTDVFVKIARRLTGQEVLVVKQLPPGFEQKYGPVRPVVRP